MAEEKVEETAPAPKKKGKLPVIIIMVVLVVAGVFIGMKAGKKDGPPPPPPPIELGEIESLGGEFLSNLADGRSYVRANISVHLAKTFKAEELKKYLATLRDAVLLSLSSKSIEEINSFEGKERLKREIAYHLNEVLGEVIEKKLEEKGAHPPATDPHAVVAPVAPIIPPQQPSTLPGQPVQATTNVVPQAITPAPTAHPTLATVTDNTAHSVPVTSNGVAVIPQKTPTSPASKPVVETKPWDIPIEKRKSPDWDSDIGPVLKIYFTDFATQ